MSFQKFREQCVKLAGSYAHLLEQPPRGMDADLALPCFALAKEKRKDPAVIAKEIAGAMKPSGLIKLVEASGPYVNFYADWDKLGGEIIGRIIREDDNFGRATRRKEKVMVEYSSPNTNKPLHVGHLRNDSLGMSISNILEFAGSNVIRTAIINDRGVHICKSMLAYKKWGNGRTPDKKSDHFVGDFYVMFEKKLKEDPGLEEEIRQMLKKWEEGDKPTRALWKKMNSWVLGGMKETYKLFGSKFDFWTLESGIYDKAKPLIDQGAKKGLFFKGERGDILAKLEPELPNKVVLRADGTSIYITQDMVLAKIRFEKHKIDRLIYVVASEQNLHFKQLFKILELLGYGWSKNCHHLSYGLVNLPTGRMKTREGTVVDADELIKEETELAKKEISAREKVSKTELEKRSKEIALAAIKYYLIKIEPIKDILFDPGRAISFEGDTGPYLQYTYARAKSILRKAKKKNRIGKGVGKEEIDLIKKLSQFPYIVKKCAVELKPNYLATYLFELATLFNSFYHAEKVIGSEKEAELLTVVESVSIVLRNGLSLLGINTLERM
ncbi:MAG: arginine--tRNA ligase [Candidatus Aenigmarchaeota archaeon]|nr:arginine--tRNA ligase [Candidatus Aenigmarchaeota archaeon]